MNYGLMMDWNCSSIHSVTQSNPSGIFAVSPQQVGPLPRPQPQPRDAAADVDAAHAQHKR